MIISDERSQSDGELLVSLWENKKLEWDKTQSITGTNWTILVSTKCLILGEINVIILL